MHKQVVTHKLATGEMSPHPAQTPEMVHIRRDLAQLRPFQLVMENNNPHWFDLRGP